jgi:hypothetical protein
MSGAIARLRECVCFVLPSLSQIRIPNLSRSTFDVPFSSWNRTKRPRIFRHVSFRSIHSDAADGGTRAWTSGPSGGTALTGTQQVQIQSIRDRDAEFDNDLDEIGEGIQDLHELALRQGEEVRRQNAMLVNTQNRVDNAHEHMTNVNSKMKETLAEVGRSTDKLCVDIMCIVSGERVCKLVPDAHPH